MLSRDVFRVGKISSKSSRRGSDGLTRTVCGSLSRPLRRRSGPVNRAIVKSEHTLVGPQVSNYRVAGPFPICAFTGPGLTIAFRHSQVYVTNLLVIEMEFQAKGIPSPGVFRGDK